MASSTKHLIAPTLAALLIFGAMIGVEAAVPDKTNHPTSSVTMGEPPVTVPTASGEDLHCQEGPGFSEQDPSWDCGETSIVARSEAQSGEPEEHPEMLRRALRDRLSQAELPHDLVDSPNDEISFMTSEGTTAVGIFDEDQVTMFFFKGPEAEQLSQPLVEAHS